MSTKPVLLPSNLTTVAPPRFAIQSHWKTAACMVSIDALSLLLVFAMAILGRRAMPSVYSFSSSIELLPCLAIVLVAFWARGLYPGVLLHPAEEMRRVVLSVSIVSLGMASTTFLWRNAESFSRSVFLFAWLTTPPVVLLFRYLLRRTMKDRSWWGVPAVVLGSGPMAQKVLRSLRDGMLGVKVTGVLPSERMLAWSYDAPQTVSELWAHSQDSQARPAQYAIVAMPERPGHELRHAIQDYCKGFSHVILVPDMPGLCSLGMSTMEIGGGFGVELPQRLFHRTASLSKRGMDVLLAGFGLLVASPLFILIAAAVKLSSPGHVFYSHVRLGRNGEKIRAWKFRTMVANANSVLEDYLATHPQDRMEWQRNHKLKNDPRVTSIGKWLRRFSLDELPQLWTVLNGQMSLIGPRPIIEAEVQRYGRSYDLYTRVRPGITGLWQVSGRNNTTYDQRVAFDEYYVRNWSGWLDIYILICTVKAVLTADGAY